MCLPQEFGSRAPPTRRADAVLPLCLRKIGLVQCPCDDRVCPGSLAANGLLRVAQASGGNSLSRKPDGMYTLYYSPGTASMCVHQALIEANAQYRLVLVDLQAGQQRDPAYLRLNPGGVVPTLLIDDAPFTETAALLMTVATRHPETRPAPAWSALHQYAARMKARPSWKKLHALEGLSEWS